MPFPLAIPAGGDQILGCGASHVFEVRVKSKLACLVVALSFIACSQIQWTGKKMMGPAKRRNSSEESAVRAIDSYFDAARDVIGITYAGNHGQCLEQHRQSERAETSDKVCSLVLSRYDEALFNLAGYGQAPSGEYPWLGEIFEYVLRTETLNPKDEKMAGIDRYVIEKFDGLLSEYGSSVISPLAADFFAIRGMCCREVTLFDDWYRARFQTKASR